MNQANMSSQAAALKAVKAAARRVDAATARLSELQTARDEAIRRSLETGVSATVVASAANVNRSRVYQIKGE